MAYPSGAFVRIQPPHRFAGMTGIVERTCPDCGQPVVILTSTGQRLMLDAWWLRAEQRGEQAVR